MKKEDFLKLASKEVGVTREAARQIVDAYVENIKNVVEEGGKFSISGFGVFSQKTYPARIGRNPKTGAPVNVPEKTVMKFKQFKN